VELQFSASPARLSEVRRAVRADLRGVVPEPDLDDILLAFNEAATNAVLHGSAGGRPVEVAVRVQGEWVELTILDWGPGPRPGERTTDEPEAQAKAALSPGGGRGLWLMGRLVDEVRLERVRHGTRITLRRQIRVSTRGTDDGTA